MRMTSGAFPAASLQVVFSANFVGLVVAVLFEWRPGDLAMLYWLELIGVGLIALVQMHTARQSGTFAKSRGYTIVLFVALYGTFCVMYLAILSRLMDGAGAGSAWFWALVWAPLAALMAAHLVSYRKDYLVSEANWTTRLDAMWIPYLRELPVHVPFLIVLAVSDVIDMGEGRTPVVTLALAKTALDLLAHVGYHTLIAPRRRRYAT